VSFVSFSNISSSNVLAHDVFVDFGYSRRFLGNKLVVEKQKKNNWQHLLLTFIKYRALSLI
jgi:hypothetical protein